jgi:hypothetical protein
LKIKSFLLTAFAFIIVMAGCAPTQTNPVIQVTPTRSPAVKPAIEYKILDLNIGTSGRCVLEIELPDRISRDEITQMAYYLSENEGKDCKPLFIYYFLPGQERKYESAWAYTHFNPDLQVKISDSDQ